MTPQLWGIAIGGALLVVGAWYLLRLDDQRIHDDIEARRALRRGPEAVSKPEMFPYKWCECPPGKCYGTVGIHACVRRYAEDFMLNRSAKRSSDSSPPRTQP